MAPARVLVREEYLVYDFVAMISSIGGTMGLFVGFSFSGLASCLMDKLQLLMGKGKKHNPKRIVALDQPHLAPEADMCRLEM